MQQQSTHEFFKVAQAQRRSALNQQAWLIRQHSSLSQEQTLWMQALVKQINSPQFREIRSSFGDLEICLTKTTLSQDPFIVAYSGELRMGDIYWCLYGENCIEVDESLGSRNNLAFHQAVSFVNELSRLLLKS